MEARSRYRSYRLGTWELPVESPQEPPRARLTVQRGSEKKKNTVLYLARYYARPKKWIRAHPVPTHLTFTSLDRAATDSPASLLSLASLRLCLTASLKQRSNAEVQTLLVTTVGRIHHESSANEQLIFSHFSEFFLILNIGFFKIYYYCTSILTSRSWF